MADLTRDPAFTSLVAGTEAIIHVFANAGVRDARLLMMRQAGWNALPGEVRGLIPLAVWFIRGFPNHLHSLRSNTSLGVAMGRDSRKATDSSLWQPIQTDLANHLAANGGDVIALGTQPSAPIPAEDIARNYLSARYAGNHRGSQAGDIVLKRTLKLLAHALP